MFARMVHSRMFDPQPGSGGPPTAGWDGDDDDNPAGGAPPPTVPLPAPVLSRLVMKLRGLSDDALSFYHAATADPLLRELVKREHAKRTGGQTHPPAAGLEADVADLDDEDVEALALIAHDPAVCRVIQAECSRRGIPAL